MVSQKIRKHINRTTCCVCRKPMRLRRDSDLSVYIDPSNTADGCNVLPVHAECVRRMPYDEWKSKRPDIT